MDPVLAAIVIGLVVGVVVGALGAGGGIIAVPVLVYALGQAPHSATASSLVILGATALTGLVHHLRRGNVDWRAGLSFGVVGVVGSLVGSRASVLVDGRVLLGLFASMMAVVAILMFRQALRARRPEPVDPAQVSATAVARPALWKVIGVALVAGLMTGFFGVGGGFIVVPALMLVLGLPMRIASGTSLVVMVIASATGLLARLGTHVSLDWPLTLAFTAASMVGGLLGGPLSHRVTPWKLTMAFACLITLVVGFVGFQLVGGLG